MYYASFCAGLEGYWDTNGVFDAHIVNYADDFVICCRGDAAEALAAMRAMMAKAEADGERDEDAVVPRAGRVV